ncbi:hypothetical protein C1O66_21190 [Paucibacter aquatile]|uniref:Uncharacterized protein n=2 Tax=Kinneretia aquatilis TaxID=2070761 RepID=A0A2N8KRY5_9BURK|nr:hypothetical protein C1O66_21190 [Paucibacter aquatile]
MLLLLGAFFFGIASCGGYVWHKELFRVVSIAMWLLAVLVPSTLLSSWKRKLGFAAAMPVAYAVFESAVSTFYPGPPASIAEFGEFFLQAMEYGPCR